MFQSLIFLGVIFLTCLNFIETSPPSDANQNLPNSAPIPTNYTVQSRLKTSLSVQKLMYSSDEAWIIYTKLNDFQSNVVYFRNRSSLEDEYFVNVGDPKVQKIEVLSYSKQGNYLLVATSRAIYTCKFAHNMTDNDCLTKTPFKLPSNQTTKWMDINSKNQVVLNSDTTIIVWNISSTGTLDSWRFFNISTSTQMRSKWHPQAESQLLILGGCTSNSSSGYIKFFNLTLNDFSYSTNVTCLYAFETLKDGKTLLVGGYNQFMAFNLTKNSVSLLGNILNKGLENIDVNYDGSLIFIQDANTVTKPYLYVYYVTMLNNVNDGLPFSFNLIYSMQSNGSNLYCPSSDGNQILFTVKSSSQITRYSLCLNNTFYSNLQCLPCSTNCTTCHVEQNNCLSCLNNSFTVLDAFCAPCTNVLAGCLTCSNTTYCLSCDSQSGFNSDPKDGLCQCPSFTYLSNTTCTNCDDSQACFSCLDSNTCLKCDTQQGFVEEPVDGKCVKGLGLGEILGICAGILVLLIGIGVFGFWWWKKRKLLKKNQLQHNLLKEEEKKVPDKIYPKLIDQEIIKPKINDPPKLKQDKPPAIAPIFAHKFEQKIIEPVPEQSIEIKKPIKKPKKKQRQIFREYQKEQNIQEKPEQRQIKEPLLVDDYKRILQVQAAYKKDKEQLTVGYSDAIFAELTDQEKMRLGLFKEND